MRATKRIAIVSLLVFATTVSLSHAQVTFILNNVDPPGVGFNDPTPVTPVGGNPGMTLGEQRLNLFQFAADLWGSVVDGPVTVVVQATMLPLTCTPTSAVLGAAGTIQIFASFPNAELVNHWYHSSLANQLAGFDLTPGPPDPGLLVPPYNDDIVAFFNSDLDADPACLGGVGWYYGFDHDAGAQVDFLNVLMHEFAHGLGFSEFIDEDTGDGPLGLPDVYSAHMHDNTTGKNWNEMIPAERLASQVNTLNLVWDGASVTDEAEHVLGPRQSVKLLARGLRKKIEAQAASFGPPLGHIGPLGLIKLVEDDGLDPDASTDGCEPILNNVHRRIALIDRGGCTFTTKVRNAQDAGARAVIIVNNQPKGFPSMGGSDPEVFIPSVGITMSDGEAIKEALEPSHHGPFHWWKRPKPVLGAFFKDRRRLAGADSDGRVRLYAPDPVEPGSSKSHWDTTASPNLLMEPFINTDLRAAENLDLTPFLFEDIGWNLVPLP